MQFGSLLCVRREAKSVLDSIIDSCRDTEDEHEERGNSGDHREKCDER